MKPKVAIVRGKFLNKYEMQFFEPLAKKFDITAFSSRFPYHDQFPFPVVKLLSPVDIAEFPKKMSILNRLFVDAHYLLGLEHKLKGFDLVHTAETYFHYTRQCLVAKKQGNVKRVIATVLENIPFNNETIHGRKEFKQSAREELDHIIALTKRAQTALLLEGAKKEKITIINHYINTKRFRPNDKRRMTRERKNILFCGRLETYKGVYEILFAAKLLLDTYDLTFTFVGDGSEKQRMVEMEKRLGIKEHVVHKQVSYDDMPQEYNNADIYVAPSKETQTWQEQYNTTLLEAQASGLPIVTTYSGGIPENVGDAALYANPGDVYSLAFALKRFIESASLRDEYGRKAREQAVQMHDISIGAAKIEEVWNKFV
jgi:glycosyltransferase involved in cell wall biosynthesis